MAGTSERASRTLRGAVAGARTMSAQAGWAVIGPMEALCLTCAPTEADAHQRYAPHAVTVEAVPDGADLAGHACARCGDKLVPVQQ